MSVWRLAGPVRFYDRGEGPVVCYAIDSGDTHLINPLASRLLGALASAAEATMAEPQLLATLSAGSPGEALSLSELQSLLSDLAAADLVLVA